MKEHKKLYKAGKLWLVAIISFVAGGVLAMSDAHADTSTPAAQTTAVTAQQANNTTTQESFAASNNQVDNSATYGNLDSVEIKDVADNSATVQVSGWNATDASKEEPYHYLIVYDNTTHTEIGRLNSENIQEISRNDVQNVYPNLYHSYQSGYQSQLQLRTSDLAHSLSLVSRYSDDPHFGEGNHTDYWSNMAFDMGNHANLDGVQVYGNHLRVNGWHASNLAPLNKRTHHFIIVFDRTTGQEICRKEVNTYSDQSNRPDVARVYPGIYNAQHSGFSVSFELNDALINDEIQFISRWTSDPAGNNNVVDYWFNQQRLFTDHGNYASLDAFTSSDGNMKIAGWHASNQALSKQYHYIIVVDQTTGREVQRTRVSNSVSRNDVARVYPQVINAANSGFAVALPYSPSLNGHRLQVVSRWTNDSAGNGYHPIDYWFSPRILVENHTNNTPTDANGYGDGAGHIDYWAIYSDMATPYSPVFFVVQGWHAFNGHGKHYTHELTLVDNTLHRNVMFPVTALSEGSYMAAYDGTHYFYNIHRPDVARVYGGQYANAVFSGFKSVIPMTIPNYGDDYTLVSTYRNTIDGSSSTRYFHIGKIDHGMLQKENDSFHEFVDD